jgi:S-adenosylmethionine:tRNA ribosyltransferase-isomerase
MQRSEFTYELPDELIARYPTERRSASRLLHLQGSSGRLHDRLFAELPALLRPHDVLVVNDTRVVPARLFGNKESGGRVEVLLERIVGDRQALVQIKASKSPKVGSLIRIAPGANAVVVGRHGSFWEVEFDTPPGPIFEQLGEMPLPPYLHRAAEDVDRERYQTVYARQPGAVAAPTAGLHFDAELLAALGERGVALTELTLHVGAGTFQPVRSELVSRHRMHAEYVRVPDRVCEAVHAARQRGGRVVAVGTTSVRALESAAASGSLRPWEGDTRLFIYPGYRFRVVDALITNFHLPESTLLMLVAAFAGQERVLRAYRHAVEERYRFFSYGDAMFVEPDVDSTVARSPR